MGSRRAARCLAVLLALSPLAAAKPFVSERYGFTITPPGGWTYTRVPGFSAEVFLPPNETGAFRSNINVLEPIATGGASHTSVCEQNARGVEVALAGAKVTRQRYDATTDVCELTYTARPNGKDLQFYAELHFGPAQYHTLTFTAEKSNFAKLLPQVKTAFRSFRAGR